MIAINEVIYATQLSLLAYILTQEWFPVVNYILVVVVQNQRDARALHVSVTSTFVQNPDHHSTRLVLSGTNIDIGLEGQVHKLLILDYSKEQKRAMGATD